MNSLKRDWNKIGILFIWQTRKNQSAWIRVKGAATVIHSVKIILEWPLWNFGIIKCRSSECIIGATTHGSFWKVNNSLEWMLSIPVCILWVNVLNRYIPCVPDAHQSTYSCTSKLSIKSWSFLWIPWKLNFVYYKQGNWTVS